MLKTRYKFIKKIYPEYIILFYKRGNTYIYQEDYKMFKNFKNGKLITFIENEHINYLIVDNMKIIKKKNYFDNEYNFYKNKTTILNIYKYLKTSN